jgi:hypothetical protein
MRYGIWLSFFILEQLAVVVVPSSDQFSRLEDFLNVPVF